MLVIRAGRPGLLDNPAELILDAVEKALNSAGCRNSLDLQDDVERGALIAIAEPCVANAIGEQWDNDSNEQRKEIFLEQRSAQLNRCAVHRYRAKTGITRLRVFLT